VGALAKVTRPKLHQVVRRERLFERLDECREKPLAWVFGPPGAGKTALVASYVESRRIGGLWYHVDPGDADLGTFFHYLSGAVGESRRRTAAPLPRLGAEHRGDLPGFARLYFRALFQRLRRPAAIVLDNYHELPAPSELHALLETIVREIPEGMWLVAISRSEPPAHCAALRALDRIALLEWDELRLTLEEARSIAARRTPLDEATLRAAFEQSGGWPVGLTLTLEQIRRFGSDATSIRDEGREVLFTYFAGQIFSSLAPATREALTRCALLPRATPEVAAHLCPDADAGALLDMLYRRRLFVDRRGAAYQFHDLFRAFLLDAFERAHTQDEARSLRLQAADALEASGDVDSAFGLACAAGAWDRAGAMLVRHAPALFEQGRIPTLHAWLDALPPDQVEATPWLLFWRAVGLSGRAAALARDTFARAFERFAPDIDDAARLMCCSGVITAYYLELDTLEPLDPWIDELLALLAKRPALPGLGAEMRVHSALMFALSFRRPQPDLLAACIARIHEILRTDCPVSARIDAAGLLLAHHANCGDLDRCTQLVALIEPLLSHPTLRPYNLALWWLQLGHARIKGFDPAGTRAAYEHAQAVARDNALILPVVEVSSRVGLASLALTLGDVDGAEAARAGLAVHAGGARRIDAAMDLGLRSIIAAHRGDMDTALALARQQVDVLEGVGILWHRHYTRTVLGFALAETGAIGELDAVLADSRELVRGTAYAPLAYHADLIAAYAALLQGDRAGANAALANALAASREDAGKFFPRMLPRLLPRLFAHALAENIDADYVRRTIRELGVRAPAADTVGWPWPIEIRTFGAFEVLSNGKPLEFSRKLPRKTLALLKAIITFGGSDVSEQRLIDTFWADEEGDTAARSLDATVLRLRNLLGDSATVIQQGGKLGLNRDRVWVDVGAFESAIAAAERAARARDPAARSHWERALALYGGAYLAGDEGEAWPVALRERLRGRFIHALVELGRELERDGDIEAAIGAYQRGLEADPVVEPFYQGLMRCYAGLDRRTEAISAYRRLKQILSITLGLAPSAATEKLYHSLR
jgi:DNA-binding SARP family transcriptional activator